MSKNNSTEKVTGKVYDVKLFRRLMGYSAKYRSQFIISVIAVLAVAGLAAVRPVLLKTIIDDFIAGRNAEMLLFFVLLMFFFPSIHCSKENETQES